jgi:excisionase family DNA binding protein
MDGSGARVLLTRRDAAAALGISVDTLGRLIEGGELRAVRVGRSVLVPTSEVKSFVTRRLAAKVGEHAPTTTSIGDVGELS